MADSEVKKRKHSPDTEDTKKLKSSKPPVGFDEEAEESGDAHSESGSGSGSGSDEDEDGNLDGFIENSASDDDSDNDDDDDDSVDAAPMKELKKLRKKKDIQLDEDDVLLVQENALEEFQNEIEATRAPPRGGTLDNADSSDDDVIAPSMRKKGGYYDDEDEDDMDGFLVEDEDEEEQGEGGVDNPEAAAAAAKRREEAAEQQRQRAAAQASFNNRRKGGPTYDQIQEAVSIFGEGYDDFDDEDDEGEDFGGGEDDEDADAAAEGGASKAASSRAIARENKAISKLRAQFDHNQIVAMFGSDSDDKIRSTDIPERFQGYEWMDNRETPDADERAAEAKWVSSKLAKHLLEEYDTTTMAGQSHELLEYTMLSTIEFVLKSFQVDHFEVPFIWSYRKDYLHPMFTRDLLWRILFLDEQWEAMYARKVRLGQQIFALTDAAQNGGDSTDESRYQELQYEVVAIQEQLSLAEASLQAAEEDEKVAMDIVDEKDDSHTEDDRERVRLCTERVERERNTLNAIAAQLQETRMQEAEEAVRLQRKSQFEHETAKEVMRLFPKERYESIARSSTNEIELQYLARFMDMLIRGTTAARSAALASTELHDNDDDASDEDDANFNGRKARAAKGRKATSSTAQQKQRVDKKKDEYSTCCQVTGIRQFVEMMAVPACGVADGFVHGLKKEPPATPAATCEAVAEQVLAAHLHRLEGSGGGSVKKTNATAVDAELGAAGDEENGKLQPLGAVRTAADVIKAGTIILASELAAEPSLRLKAREVFLETATISTRPTTVGLQTITPYNEYFGLHLLKRKPLKELYRGADRTLYTRLFEAQRDGLLTVSIDAPVQRDADGMETLDAVSFMTELRLVQLLMPTVQVSQDPNPHSRLSWDTARLDALRLCIEKYLIPSLQKEFHRDLMKTGRDAIVDAAAKNFENLLSVGPFRPPHMDFRDDVKELLWNTPKRPTYPTVLSVFVPTNFEEPLYLAYVNKDGVLRAHDFVPREAANSRKSKIQRFMLEYRPTVIVVNAGGGQQARSLMMTIEKDILREVIQEVEQEDARRKEQRGYDDEEVFVPYKADVLLVNDKVATIFRNSSRAQKHLPDLPPFGAAAVCLARFVQEPLAEYCDMWTALNSAGEFGHELLFLDLHPKKRMLLSARMQLMRAIQCKLVDAVCEVGVDLNTAVTHGHRSALLAFVGGLGLRKADALKVLLRRSSSGIASSRNDLLTKKYLEKCVWTNAAGFLKICDISGVEDEEEEESSFELLDNTRIHPECYITYNIALKMCADALDKDMAEFRTTAERNAVIRDTMWKVKETLLKRIKKTPHWLDLWEKGRPAPNAVIEQPNDGSTTMDGKTPAPVGVELPDVLFRLILDDYANDLETQGAGKRRLQMEQIKDEIRYPCLDMRPSVKSISSSELFTILTNETDQSLYVGMQVGCTILEISDKSFADDGAGGMMKRHQKAVAKLDSGMRATINARDVIDSDRDHQIDFDTFNISDHVRVGAHLPAVVVGVHKERMQVDLSIKPSHLAMTEADWMRVRSTDRNAERWWRGTGRDPHSLFDPHFLENEALKLYATTDAVITSEASKVALQKLTQSTGGVFMRNSSAGSAATAGSSGGGGAPAGKQQLMRRVVHPQFANVDFKQAEERLRLQGKGAGAMLVRPSSKGSDYLTITWAFQDGWYKHISVKEFNKRAGDLGLGRDLFVEGWDEAFSDLDHLFVMYIEPMNDLVTAMCNYRKFHSGSFQDVESAMRSDISADSHRIPYYLCFDHSAPGNFILTWMSTNANSTQPVKKQRVAVQPNGFKIVGSQKGEGIFSTPTEIVNWFKRTMQQQQELAAEAATKQKNMQASVAAANQQQQQTAVAAAGGGAGVRRSRFENASNIPVPAPAPYPSTGENGYGGFGGGMVPPPVTVYGGAPAPPLPPPPQQQGVLPPPPPPMFQQQPPPPQQQQQQHRSRFSNQAPPAPTYDHHYY